MTIITGREPALSTKSAKKAGWKLSARGLNNFMAAASPHMISLNAAEEMLRHPDFGIRYNAARMLRERGDRDARLIMARVLTDGAVPSRASAARHLAGFSWVSAEPLLHQALADSDARVREAAIYALCDFDCLPAYQLMRDVLRHEDDFVRMAAAWGLRDRHDPEALPVLETVLLADDPEVRVKALEVLSANGLRGAVDPCQRLMDSDPDPDARYAAVLSFIELTEDRALEKAAQAIADAEGRIRVALLRGFFHATNYLHILLDPHPAVEGILEVIEVCLHDPDPAVRHQAIWIPAWMKHERAVAILHTAYDAEASSELKAAYLRVIVSLMSPIADELWQAALASDVSILREMAERLVDEHALSPVKV